MTDITFAGSDWAALDGKRYCDDGTQDGRTIPDVSGHGVTFSIDKGSMIWAHPAHLSYFRATCSGGPSSSAQLAIRFDTPQEYVRLRLTSESGDATVVYYRNRQAGDVAESRTVFLPPTPKDVVYSSSDRINEITVSAEKPENRLWELEFYESRPTLVTFAESEWGAFDEVNWCGDGTQEGDTIPDILGHGISFTIENGSMHWVSYPPEHLYFSRLACDYSDSLSATLVIRFDIPQEYVRFRAGWDPFVIPPETDANIVVDYYREHGRSDLVESRSIPWSGAEDVEYSSTDAIKEVTILTKQVENFLWEIEFYESVVVPTTRHDIALALDGSGSMSAQNKWGAMIEAAALFHDLYRELGDPSDGFGAVLFRWACGDTSDSGDRTVDQPPLQNLDVPVDLPALYANEGPAECTPVGEGLWRAADLADHGENPDQHVLLLTDGKSNRGRSVAGVEGSEEVMAVTVHTLGLGSGVNINEAEIAWIAELTGGLFRSTTDPSEVLDFFAEALGDMLGKVEIAYINGNAVQIAPGTTKAVFLIGWSDPAVEHDFNLTDPNGNFVDHNSPNVPGATCVYRPATSQTAHAYFVVDGAIDGTWQFSTVPDGVKMIALEDLDLTIQWKLTPQLGLTGQPITLEARIQYQGAPYKGDVSVSAEVTRPDEAQGDLVARGVQQRSVSKRLSGDTSLRSQIISEVLDRHHRTDFLFRTDPEFRFERTGDGIFRLRFTQTDYDGVYRFGLKAEGRDDSGKLVFARRATRFSTLVSDVDGSRSITRAVPLGHGLYRVAITPVGKSGALMGPFMANHLTVQAAQGRAIGPLRDNLDGSYTQIIGTAGQEPKGMFVGVLGRSVPIGGPAAKTANRLPWILVALLVLIVLVMLLF